MLNLSRRTVVKLGLVGGGLFAKPSFVTFVGAGERQDLVGADGDALTLFGGRKYPRTFKHLDYVNPDAPKGGTFRFIPGNWGFNQNFQTFNTLNPFTIKGDGPPRSELCFDTLMSGAADEVDTVYGLVAEHVDVLEKGNVYIFTLDKAARFHDGTPIRAEDVVFSLQIIKSDGYPTLSEVLREMLDVKADGSHRVIVTLSGKQNLKTILVLASTMPILQKKWFETRKFGTSTFEPLMGSGPYQIGKFEAGRFIEYDRVKDYWARYYPLMIGTCNFDTLRVEFFRERQAGLEAFKKGSLDFREEFTSKTWATEYDFPAVRKGKVIVSDTLFPAEKVPSLQSWFINSRLNKFSDSRTRQAIGLAFDFEWTNENLFFNAYNRQQSVFGTSEFAAKGLPSSEELSYLEPLRPFLSPEVFGPALLPPKSNGSGRDRSLLRKAARLLKAAGWSVKNGVQTNEKGQSLTVEFMIRSPIFERVLSPFVENLKYLAIPATIRLVDPAQYQERLDHSDFEITGQAFGFSPTPLEGLDLYFSSRSADQVGSRNYGGFKNKALDDLLLKLDRITSRQEMVVLLRCMDRIIRSTYILIPNWYSGAHRVAFWDKFGWPEKKPDFAFPVETTWWYDQEKANRLEL